MQAPSRITAITDIDFLLSPETTIDRVIDLQGVTHIRPVGVVAVLATMENLLKRPSASGIRIMLPRDSNVRSYLRSTGVFDAIREFAVIDDPQPETAISEWLPLIPMVPCTHFRTVDDIEELARQMEELFHDRLMGYGSLLGACYTAFTELATNVVYHADSQGGFVLAQQYNDSAIEIAVADCGIGIRESLRKNPEYADRDLPDVAAIALAMEEGVSSVEDDYRGYGLEWVAIHVRGQASRGITIRSGSGTVALPGTGSIGTIENQPYYPGTIVNVTIPCGTGAEQ